MAPSQLMQDLQSRLHPQLAQLVQEATSKHLLELYAICVDDRLISADLLALVPWVVQWVVQLSHTTLLTLHRSQPHQRGSSPPPSDYQFLDIHSVEEAIHMPILGIKGQLDMIAHCRATSSPQHSASSSSSAPPMLVPIELKTGQWRTSTVMSHRAQVLIYMLLLHLRHHLQCRTSADSMSESMPMMIPNKIGSVGVCVYLSKSDFRMDLIWPQWDEVRHLLIARNALAWASQLRDASPLFSELSSCREDMPRILNDKFTCEGCFQAAECLLSHTAASVVAIEDGRPTTTGLTSDSEATSSISNLANLAGYILRGLRPRHIQYFKYWQQILQLESLAIAGYRDSSSKQGACQSSIYALRGAYRERVHQGRCLANCHYRSHRSIRHVRGHTLLEVILQRSAPTSAAATGNSSGNSNFESKAAVFNCPVAVGERLMLSFELESASKACLSEDVLTRILPAMATASLVSASPQGEIVLHIHQSVTNALRLFDDLVSRQQLLRKEVSIRLDREDSQVSLQTMRSALLEVMVEPFNPAAYRETSRSISRSKSEWGE